MVTVKSRGFDFRAIRVWPAGQEPVDDHHQGLSGGYFSSHVPDDAVSPELPPG